MWKRFLDGKVKSASKEIGETCAKADGGRRVVVSEVGAVDWYRRRAFMADGTWLLLSCFSALVLSYLLLKSPESRGRRYYLVVSDRFKLVSPYLGIIYDPDISFARKSVFGKHFHIAGAGRGDNLIRI